MDINRDFKDSKILSKVRILLRSWLELSGTWWFYLLIGNIPEKVGR